MQSKGKEGWIYITKDTGDMYIQTEDNSADRKIHLNANCANKLRVENTGDINTPVYFENGIPKVTTEVATKSQLIGVNENLNNYIKKPPKKDTPQQVTTNAIARWENTEGELKNSSIIIEEENEKFVDDYIKNVQAIKGSDLTPEEIKQAEEFGKILASDKDIPFEAVWNIAMLTNKEHLKF